MEESSRRQPRVVLSRHEEEDEVDTLASAGIAVIVLLGAFLAVAPRLGYREVQDNCAVAFIFTCAAIVISLLVRNHFYSGIESPAEEHPDVGANKSEIPDAKRRGSSQDENLDEEHEDPLWNADWSNAEERGVVARQLSASIPPRPAEVFEMNDTPTWLASLQKRRDQAQRAGKTKLVQKIEKEIADAARAHALSPQKERERPSSRPMPDERNSSKGTLQQEQKEHEVENDEDVWDMDWSALSSKTGLILAAGPDTSDTSGTLLSESAP